MDSKTYGQSPTTPCSVLFLDVDGVLNKCGFSTVALMPELLQALVRIVEATDCRIVISSTWRCFPKALAELTLALDDLGLVILGVTPDHSKLQPSGLYTTVERGHEIQAWMDANGTPERFVILDDNSDMAHLKDKLVQTNSFWGITEETERAAISALNAVVRDRL